MQFSINVDGVKIVNPGSVGQPRDGDPRTAYAVIDGDKIELKRVDYPIDETIARVKASPLPERAKRLMINSLRFGCLAGSARSVGLADATAKVDPDVPGDAADKQE
jgi:hypothetical protein